MILRPYMEEVHVDREAQHTQQGANAQCSNADFINLSRDAHMLLSDVHRYKMSMTAGVKLFNFLVSLVQRWGCC